MAVDRNAPAIVSGKPDMIETQTVGIRFAPRRNEHDIGRDGFGIATALWLEYHVRTLGRLDDGGDLLAEFEVQSLLFEDAQELLGDIRIHAAENGVEIFDDGDFRTEPRPDRAKFEADHATADDDHRRRNAFQFECARRGHDHLFIDVDIDTRNARDVGACGDDDVLRLKHRGFAIFACHGNFACARNRADAVMNVDLVLFHEKRHAFDIGFHHVVLVRHHLLEIELRRHVHAEACEPVRRLVEHVGRMKQRLGGDAADVEAGAAKRLALLDDRRLQPQLRAFDRADISARPRADHHHIISHHHSPSSGRQTLQARYPACRAV